MRKICLFTSTRADWGLLSGLAAMIRKTEGLKLQLLVTGTHLSKEFGYTYNEIVKDGFEADEKVEITLSSDSPHSTCLSMGLALMGFGTALGKLAPDILVILGDRYEALCAAASAQVLKIPIAHIHGGESTEGAIDEAFRHSITKMSHIHFPSCEAYRKRILQLGEDPARVFNVGALGAENIHKAKFATLADLSKFTRLDLSGGFFLVTYHPATLCKTETGSEFGELLKALDDFKDYKIIFTYSNADPSWNAINRSIDEYISIYPGRCAAFSSMGAHRYLSAMKYSSAVIGNSSSGVIEAPVLKTPSVNIGNRQKGRIKPQSVVDCMPVKLSIAASIERVLQANFRNKIRKNTVPFDKPATSRNIVNVLKKTELNKILTKVFIDY